MRADSVGQCAHIETRQVSGERAEKTTRQLIRIKAGRYIADDHKGGFGAPRINIVRLQKDAALFNAPVGFGEVETRIVCFSVSEISCGRSLSSKVSKGFIHHFRDGISPHPAFAFIDSSGGYPAATASSAILVGKVRITKSHASHAVQRDDDVSLDVFRCLYDSGLWVAFVGYAPDVFSQYATTEVLAIRSC